MQAIDHDEAAAPSKKQRVGRPSNATLTQEHKAARALLQADITSLNAQLVASTAREAQLRSDISYLGDVLRCSICLETMVRFVMHCMRSHNQQTHSCLFSCAVNVAGFARHHDLHAHTVPQLRIHTLHCRWQRHVVRITINENCQRAFLRVFIQTFACSAAQFAGTLCGAGLSTVVFMTSVR